jgi:ketosteroid isomerase-like protein
LESIDVVSAGENILEIGRATLSVAPEGKPAEIVVKYVVYWREEDGRWKWNVDIWNSES